MTWRDDQRVTSVLDDGKLLYVAVTSRSGPHVTPTAFDREGRRLWFVTPRRSVKARAIRRHRRVAAVVHLDDRAVMVGGRARIVDPLGGRGLSPRRLVRLPLAATGFLARNDRHVAGTLRDHPSPTLALSRVMVSIDITRVALLEGHRVVASWGDWADPVALASGAPAEEPPDLSGVPSGLRPFLEADVDAAVLGWQTPTGPVALPARWRATGVAETSAAALTLAGGAATAPACLTVDRSRYRLKHKRGLLLAGTGRAGADGEVALVTISADRVVWWDGEDTGTTIRTGNTLSGRGAGHG